MQEAPARLVQRLYETFARQDTEGALALIDPEIVIEYSGADARGTYHGYAGMNKLLQRILGSFERGVGAASGAEVEIRIGQVWTVQGGRAVRWEIYPDFEQAHSAVGLP